MRILHLITHYYPHVFGAELFAQKLAESQAKVGHQVDVVTGRWNSSWSYLDRHNGVTIYRVDVNQTRYIQTLLFCLPQYKYAQRLINSNDYHLIHAHIFPSVLTGAKLKSKAKKIITLQGGDLADYKEIFGPVERIWYPPLKWAINQYDTVHVVSQSLKNRVEKISGRSDAVIIPNGVDLPSSISAAEIKKVRKKYFPKTKFILFSPSRLTPKNNLEETIKAIKLVRSKGFDLGLVIAGTGHLAKDLQNLIQDLNLEASVILLGSLDHHLVMPLIQSSDAMIRVPNQEGFGIAVLEGLASGVPVIASKSGGLADFVSDKVAYIPSNLSAKSIAETIVLALKDKHQAKKSKTARKMIKEKYLWERILEDLPARIATQSVAGGGFKK